MSLRRILIYKTAEGLEPFVEWIEELDRVSQVRIRKRIARIEMGNLGDYKSVGSGVYELRFFFNSGYRVYFGMRKEEIVLLLCGGDKSTQQEDIKRAIFYWKGTQNEIIS